MTCGCEAVRDQESWHVVRRTELCESAKEYRRLKQRDKYAHRRAAQGANYNPMPGKQKARWVPGTDVIIPEEDPL